MELITVDDLVLVAYTEQAIMVKDDNGTKVWLPKSLVEETDLTWLAKKNGWD